MMIIEKPLFSVIMPLYNKKPHVARAISSIIKQRYYNIELIIVDDASTDGSIDEVKKFNDSRIRLLHRTKSGPGGYAARNYGIANAKGEWIAFLDADDEWLPEHLGKMYQLSMKFPECDYLSCGWQYVFDNNNLRSDKFYKENSGMGCRIIQLEEYMSYCIKKMQPTWTGVSCIRNTENASNLFPEGKLEKGGDLYAWLLYMILVKKMAWSPHIGAKYYYNSVNKVTQLVPHTYKLPKVIVNDFEPLLNKSQRKLLYKYSNRLSWHVWKMNFSKEKENPFKITDKLYWKNDILFCIIITIITNIPGSILMWFKQLKYKLRKLLLK